MYTSLFWIKENTPGRLGIMPRPRGGDQLPEEIQSLALRKVDLLVSLLPQDEMHSLGLDQEAELCTQFGLHFYHFPLPDRLPPPDTVQALELATELGQMLLHGRTVVLHDRLCGGRAASMAAATLVTLGLDPAESMVRVRAGRGMNIPDAQVHMDWIHHIAVSVTSDGLAVDDPD
ncbi:MAG: hypothetical protein D6722_18920 [Bacteroidetes bacterium]|nr:MAG: hypothetical protein D6722_18920 [Bacteroidota bacterium]